MLDLDDLHPLIRPWCTKLITDLKEVKQINSRMIQGFRDPAYQDQLHAQRISNLTGVQSKHCFMLDGVPASKAFDLGIFKDDGSYITDGTDIRYKIAGSLWCQYKSSVIMIWGGNFIHAKPDWDHFEIS